MCRFIIGIQPLKASLPWPLKQFYIDRVYNPKGLRLIVNTNMSDACEAES